MPDPVRYAVSVKPNASTMETYQSRRAEASAERRQRVLRAASSCFSRNGYQKATIEQIAAEASVSKALVFTFFGTKKLLFQAIVSETLQEWRNFSENEAMKCADDPRQELRHLFTGSFEFVSRYPMLWVMLRHDDREWLEAWSHVIDVNRAWQERLTRVLQRGIGMGLFRSDLDVHRNAEVIHEIQRALLGRAFEQLHTRPPDATLVETTAELIVNGLSR